MSKTLRLALNLLLTFALLAGSSLPAQAAAQAQSTGSPLESPPVRFSLQPGAPPLTARAAGAAVAMPDQAAFAWQNPIPGTCVVFSQLNATSLAFDLFAYTQPADLYQRILSSPADEIEPQFNHGCTAIVYTSAPAAPAKEDLYRINPDGAGLVRLTQNQGNNYNPAWTRDGSKIAFTSDRDGQPEVYVMNADGSGQTRLTRSGGDVYHNFDGMPAWSPDGKQIAFVSNRTGGYRIWVMNADGSSPVQRSTQAYSFHPHWSPDGSRITYDAVPDNSNIAFQRLQVLWTSSWIPQLVLTGQDANETTDVYAGGLSPDGTDYYYNVVHWAYDPGVQAWLWTSAVSMYTATMAFNFSSAYLTPWTLDWYPSWETYAGPASEINPHPLPAVSPSPVVIDWSSPFINQFHAVFDVQYQQDNGPWQDLLIASTSTTASLAGSGGHTYHFRVRSRDGFFNNTDWPAVPQFATTVENQPPVTTLAPLPSYIQGTQCTLNLSSVDAGGSAILSYSVQFYSSANPTWTDLPSQGSTAVIIFHGSYGNTYYFRARGTDAAGNVEGWPAGSNGIVSTTFFASQLSGAVQDASGIPLQGLAPSLSVTPVTGSPSGPDGSYSDYFSYTPTALTAAWSRTGYGDLPAAKIDLTQTQPYNVYLPPPDNAIANGGFETGSFGPSAWVASGGVLPFISTSTVHSGVDSAALGNAGTMHTSVFPGNDEAKVVAGPTGRLYAIWPTTSAIYYATRLPPTGSWSSSKSIATLTSAHPALVFLVDAAGALTVFYYVFNPSQIMMVRMAPGGQWSPPQAVPATTSTRMITAWTAQVDANNQVHLVWVDNPANNQYTLSYARFASGSWSPAQAVASSGYPLTGLRLALGSASKIALFWGEYTGAFSTAYVRPDYAQQIGGGSWSSPLSLSSADVVVDDMIVDSFGLTRLVWQTDRGEIDYLRQLGDGSWAAPVVLPGSPPYFTLRNYSLSFNPDNSLTAIWDYPLTSSQSAIFVSTFYPDGSWSSPVNLTQGLPASTNYQFYLPVIHDQNGVHIIFWGEQAPAAADFYYALLDPAGSISILPIFSENLSNNYSQVTYTIAGPYVNVFRTVYPANGGDPINQYEIDFPGQYAANDSVLSQAVTLSPAASHPGLSFLYQYSGAPDANPGFTVQVTGNDGETTLFSTRQATAGWAHQWIDLSPWAGQTVTLTFTLHQPAGLLPAYAFLDEVSAGSTYSDAWVQATPVFHALPGGQVTVPMTYGNHGRLPAAGAVLTLTLPAGLTFVSASVDPTSIAGSVVTWDLGDLPVQSGPAALTVTLQVDASFSTFTPLAFSAVLAQTSPELETANNTAASQVAPILQVFLPILRK